PCLKYQLKRCSAPCVGKITQEEYLNNIANIEAILAGKKEDLIEQLKQKMDQAAKELNYEVAAILRDQIWALEKTIIHQKVLSTKSEISLGVLELKNILKLPREPIKIEAFDISNLSGTDPTGSLVVFINGKAEKREYRRFKIRGVTGANDVAMMQEVIERRYQRLLKEDQALPDLVVVDGGKPQLNAALKVLIKLNLGNLPTIGLAKRFEHVFVPNNPNPIVISPDSPALFLLQRIRDEAHRFALQYHRLLRRKKIKNPD
ncbi:MAG: UvrB/UvrC motif-containing protein, partial [Candidatus Helarchaeota archaeon]